MLTDRGSSALSVRRRDNAGVALVVTLALLVLVTVTVVAFFSRTTTNQQIASGSSQGVVVTTFADGATQEIIAGLQKEMWDVSGQPAAPASPTGAPIIFPQTTAAGSIPSRVLSSTDLTFPSGTAPDPNATYSQFGNLVKQSLFQKPVYSGGTSARIPAPASAVSANTSSVGGRRHDGVYWNQAQLVSVPNSDTTTLNKYLVPNWIYTNRGNSAPNDPNDTSKQHPTVYVSNSGMEPSANGALGPNTIIGRYAYNVYDIGGLLNANVAGYGAGVSASSDYSTKAKMIFPGYKGSVLMADLSGLALGGNLTTNGASAGSVSNWQSKLPSFRYPASGSQSWANDLPFIFASGQYGGWLGSFLRKVDPDNTPYNATAAAADLLKNGSFSSRQDLITWVNSQWSSDSGGSAAWTLPYLTQFSYDTNAPSYSPDPARPKDAIKSAAGGNDVLDSGSVTDDNINPAFSSILDINGNPLVKWRFPLSVLSLLDDVYPGKPPASNLAARIQYDFGLVWDGTNNCWTYQDPEGTSTGIKKLSEVAALPSNQRRSPNFFELLKAAITAGSLGKQWANDGTITRTDNLKSSIDSDLTNTFGDPQAIRYAAINYQIAQIGANIISQSTRNYYPTAINLNGTMFYGVKDLPYFYRSRLLSNVIGKFTDKDMHDTESGGGYSTFAAFTVQPELWNPHAPNLLAPTTNYPQFFRIVPDTHSFGMYARLYFSQNQTQNWEIGGTKPIPTGTGSNGVITGDYTAMGGPNVQPIAYDGSANNYIKFGGSADIVPNTTLPSPLGSFREPCPLASTTPGAPGLDFPPNINLSSAPVNATMAVGEKLTSDGSPNTVTKTGASGSGAQASSTTAIPYRFRQTVSNIAPSNSTLGFLLTYYCCGPGTKALSVASLEGGNVTLNLQYSPDGGAHFYTYDQIPSSAPLGIAMWPANAGNQQTMTGVRADPRTHRWGMLWSNVQTSPGTYPQVAPSGTNPTEGYAGLTFAPTSDLTSVNYGTQGTLPANEPKAPGWSLATASGTTSVQQGWLQINQPGVGTNYKDPDGVVRRGDGAYGGTNNSTGLPEVMLSAAGSDNGGAVTSYSSRPVVLNRPFQSVAELGYVFRDTPWRSLDFFTPESGDAALLDTFCVYGPDPYSYKDAFTAETGLVASRVNLNTRQVPVLAALLKGATTTTPASGSAALVALDDAQATAVAKGLVAWTTSSDAGRGPLRNPAEIVGKYYANATTKYSGFSGDLTSLLTNSDSKVIKQQRECVMRALSDAGTTRTWNLLIDLVAQTGQLSSNPAGLQSFVVNGERHIWVSVAVDRVTGKVVKMQVEPVRQ